MYWHVFNEFHELYNSFNSFRVCVDVIVWVMHVDSHMLGSLVASKSLTGLDGVPSH